MIPLRDDIRASRRPVVNYLLIGTCAVAFGYQQLSAMTDPEAGNAIVRAWGMIPRDITSGRHLWTLLTSMFLHGGFLHFIGNMLYLWIFGDNIEDAFGHFAYPSVYLASGLLGSGLHILLSPGSPVPTIGASGAISGVMGAYFVLYPRARVLTVIPIFFFLRMIYLPAGLLLGFWILFQVLNGCSAAPGAGGIAYFAHIGGFGAGVLFGLLAKPRVRRPWYEIS
ncbi:rhomboid family intramembrane serine protease [candidate division WOR-3 bacterium]|nr:rhomboid family intramembrane serine protease [candidate division WOR-3 bacterium]